MYAEYFVTCIKQNKTNCAHQKNVEKIMDTDNQSTVLCKLAVTGHISSKKKKKKN